MMPKIVIVIGNSCAGKSTFARYYNNYFDNIYNDIDDYLSLQEVFKIDDILWQGDLQKFLSCKDQLSCSFEIWEAYNKLLKKGEDVKKYLYTKPAVNGGHDIIKPLLWDKILKFSLNNIEKDKLYIIQFSRGRDLQYEKEFGLNNIYDRSLHIITDNVNIDLIRDMLIVNLSANLDIRKKRNVSRRLDGGHYVSDETMVNVYNRDMFVYHKISEKYGYKIIDNFEIPVYEINNDNDLEESQKEKYFLCNIREMLNIK
ncbi:MAG: hypothetical protein PHI32_15565 [Dysgonamonadaceae bacterium]|nr:hypothetical protein [Dysgonamonadaceae bacterium]